eukprot:7186558-Prymnesium_polylepis.1
MPRYGNTSRSDVSLYKTPHMNTTKLHAGRVNRLPRPCELITLGLGNRETSVPSRPAPAGGREDAARGRSSRAQITLCYAMARSIAKK